MSPKQLDESRREVVTLEAGGLHRLGLVNAIKPLILEHGVVCVRGHSFSPQGLAEFGAAFGEIARITLPEASCADGAVLVLRGRNKDGSRGVLETFGRGWHTDYSVSIGRTGGFTLLFSLEVPISGGETEFVSVRLQEMPATAMELLMEYHVRPEEACLLHQNARFHALGLFPIHRLVRRHPETADACLFLGSAEHSSAIGWGWTRGRRFVRDMFDLITAPNRIFKHRWRVGDLLVWDNRLVCHRAAPYNPADGNRHLLRVATYAEDSDAEIRKLYACETGNWIRRIAYSGDPVHVASWEKGTSAHMLFVDKNSNELVDCPASAPIGPNG